MVFWGHDSALRLYWAGDNISKWDEFYMNHAPGAGSIARPVDQQSSALPLYHRFPPPPFPTMWYKK